MEERTFYALNSGAIGNQYNWRTDRAEGYIIPTYEFKRYDEYCRNFTQVVKIDGKSQTIHGSACKQVDGTWRMVS